MARWTINDWNAKIDRSLSVRRLGRNGILYEYELPYGANPNRYYEEAVNVKSIKRSEEYPNGKRPGQYQPIGDKRYFNYYQLQKMTSQELTQFMLEHFLQQELINMLKEGLSND